MLVSSLPTLTEVCASMSRVSGWSCCAGERAPAGTSSAVLKVGDQEINVFCNPNFIAGTNELHRIDHFCLMVESATMNELIAALREAGLEIVEGPTERRDGAAVFLHDPDGVRVELQIKNSG
jgi:hypothetical protein